MARSILLAFILAAIPSPAQPLPGFTLPQVKSYPFPNELATSASGARIAWAFNEQGRRNVWVAEGPEFKARRLTAYLADDGQELSSLSVSRDGRYVVYVRGGEHGSNWERSAPVNPASSTKPTPVQIWSIPFSGGDPKLLAPGDGPVISPSSDLVAYEQDRAIWVVPIDGSSPARRLFSARGDIGSPQWSPDGARLAFVADRGDHSFIGVWSGDSNPILWLAPSTSRDSSPRWSPDGTRIVFTRRAGSGGPPSPLLVPRPTPWSIWTADSATGEGRQIWKSGTTLRDSPPTTHGGTNLHWAARGRIVFLSYADGWPHLYSIPETGGTALLLTPGNFMCEMISLSPDGAYLLASANTGPLPDDVDRRHLLRIPVDRAAAELLTPGQGNEWSPLATGDRASIVFIGAGAQRPPLPMIMPASGGTPRALAEDAVPKDFPAAALVTPRMAVFRSTDGLEVHGQIFEPAGGPARKPAIVYIHGGPPRQMLLGWHYSDYYANAYSSNQYLASRGFVVLSVNYRLGIGYGFDFHRPPQAGAQGASEYRDILAAGRYLQSLPGVDPRRIGVYGGSYGGYLTALALARNSDVFAAGVDIHGVHDFTAERARSLLAPAYEKAPDIQKALDIAWNSSPVSAISTWKSPVLLIHADDDRNVRFSQTVDLVQRLSRAGVSFEEIVIPDDTHHFLRHANWLRVNSAAAAFFERKLAPAR
jgi:dipeptidyl aminopeptidase/acylaminoacyl peptidase